MSGLAAFGLRVIGSLRLYSISREQHLLAKRDSKYIVGTTLSPPAAPRAMPTDAPRRRAFVLLAQCGGCAPRSQATAPATAADGGSGPALGEGASGRRGPPVVFGGTVIDLQVISGAGGSSFSRVFQGGRRGRN